MENVKDLVKARLSYLKDSFKAEGLAGFHRHLKIEYGPWWNHWKSTRILTIRFLFAKGMMNAPM